MAQDSDFSLDLDDFDEEFSLFDDDDDDVFSGFKKDSNFTESVDTEEEDSAISGLEFFDDDTLDDDNDKDGDDFSFDEDLSLIFDDEENDKEDEENGSAADTYADTVDNRPPSVIRKKNDGGTTRPEMSKKVRKEMSEQDLTPSDFRLLSTQETVSGIDLVSEGESINKELHGSVINQATKKRAYHRKRGVLSKKEIDFFVDYSKYNASNARYPEEYSNVLRSNQELLDNSTLAYRKYLETALVRGFTEEIANNQVHRTAKRIVPVDREILRIVAQLKYASTRQVARAINKEFIYTRNRLVRLRHLGLTRTPVSPYYEQQLWCVSPLGMMLSDIDLSVPNADGISVAMLQHTTVANNVAAYIYSGTVNVLDEDNFPPRGRVDIRGNITTGENFVSESQIRSSLGKLTSVHAMAGTKGDVYIPLVVAERDKKFEKWSKKIANGEKLPSPERELGNEYMWVLFPPPRLGIVQHIPDLVVPRDRDDYGDPRSVAIEVELQSKSVDDYVRTLKAYAHDKKIFEKVVWICSKKHTATLLSKAAEEERTLLEEGRIDILPIETENGVFKGRNVLALG